MHLIIKNYKIRWHTKSYKDIKTDLKNEIRLMVHDLWDSHIYVNT